MYSNSM